MSFESLNVKQKIEIKQVHQCNSAYLNLLETKCFVVVDKYIMTQKHMQFKNPNSNQATNLEIHPGPNPIQS
jgi:hypothetical protein